MYFFNTEKKKSAFPSKVCHQFVHSRDDGQDEFPKKEIIDHKWQENHKLQQQ